MKCLEFGYRGALNGKLFIDANYYYNWYTNFIGFINGAEIFVDALGLEVLDVYRVATNSEKIITTQGFSAGLNYYIDNQFTINGNYSWNVLNKQSDDPIIPSFNTPANKFNIGFKGRDLAIKKFKGIGFNINYKWIQGFIYEGSPQFTGSIPTYGLLDAQVNKLFDKLNLTLKLGASNALNNQVIQVYGGPYVGRMLYLSLSYDWKDK